MQRRDLLRLIGTVAAVPVFSGWTAEELWGLAEASHLRTSAYRGILDPHQLETVATIGEIILPKTGTPGARDVGCAEFIDLLMTEWYDDKERGEFVAGLVALDSSAAMHGAKTFLELTPALQKARVGSLDVAEKPVSGSAEAAYRTIKQLTVYAYFTSRPVQRDVLKVSIWPNRYDGCIPAAGVEP